MIDTVLMEINRDFMGLVTIKEILQGYMVTHGDRDLTTEISRYQPYKGKYRGTINCGKAKREI